MSKGKITLFVAIGVLVILAAGLYGFFKGNYNRFVTLDEGVKASWAQVENQLQRRYDLIPNLVETVKGFAAQEKSVLVEVTNARAKVGGAGSIPDKINANNELSGALSRLLVVVEKYPDLKSNQNFLKLQDELAGTETGLPLSASVTTRPFRGTMWPSGASRQICWRACSDSTRPRSSRCRRQRRRRHRSNSDGLRKDSTRAVEKCPCSGLPKGDSDLPFLQSGEG